MATLIQSYEQQYSVLSAEITAKIGRLKLGNEDNRDQLSREIQANFEEANDLLEQLELECRGAGAGPGTGPGAGPGAAARARVSAHRAELQRVRDEFRAAVSAARPGYAAAAAEAEAEEYEEWGGGGCDARRQLLDNAERLERGGRALQDGARLALDAERAGAAVLQDLALQRETIERSRGRLRAADEQLGRSGRLARGMLARALQERFVLAALFLVLGLLVCLALYFYA